MALPAGLQIDVRVLGSNLNGGGFNPARAGTDFSQQNSPQHSVTNLEITSNPQRVRSASITFDSTHHGNCLRIISGTGFTVDTYEITGSIGGDAILDRNAGTGGSTNGTARVGGALETLQTAADRAVPGNTLWIQGGFYPTTSTISLETSGTYELPIKIRGYTTTHGDNGQASLLASGSTIDSVIELVAPYYDIKNLVVSGDYKVLYGIITASRFYYLENVVVTHATQNGFLINDGPGFLVGCLATKTSGDIAAAGFSFGAGGGITLERCHATENYGCGFSVSNCTPTLLYCLSTNNRLPDHTDSDSHGCGIYVSDLLAPYILHATIYGNKADGIAMDDLHPGNNLIVQNCLIEKNVGYGIRAKAGRISPHTSGYFERTALFNNPSGSLFGVTSGAWLRFLHSTAFTGAASGNFTLNGNFTGGLRCGGDGRPGPFLSLPYTSGYADIGAVPLSGYSVVPSRYAPAEYTSIILSTPNLLLYYQYDDDPGMLEDSGSGNRDLVEVPDS